MMKIRYVPGRNVHKKPQGWAAAGSANLHLEPTMCKKQKTLNRETGRMSWTLID